MNLTLSGTFLFPMETPLSVKLCIESPSSTRLEALVPSRDSRARTRSPSHAHGDLTSLAPHERLPEILVVPREKTPKGAAARSIRGARESRGLLSSHFRANETSSMLVSRT